MERPPELEVPGETLLNCIPGWNEEVERAFSAYKGRYIAGRVAARHKTVYEIFIPGARVQAAVSGAMRRIGRYPVVGDFVVLLDRAELNSYTIMDILPRMTCLARGSAGESSEEQGIAANIDTIFIVTAVGKDLNLRRIERYLTIVYSSGASPVIVLNKTDLADDPDVIINTLRSVAGDVPIHGVSALTKDGLDVLASSISPNETVALIGSSGVGKSTLVNAFFDATVQKTMDIREDDGKGRHTTTVRQLFLLPNGGIFIDNPGIREIQLGDFSEGVDKTFSDILELARNCKFKDCTHRNEPHCAVREAIHRGLITEERVNSYHKLMDELAFQSERAELGLKRLEKKKYKGMLQGARNYRKYTGK